MRPASWILGLSALVALALPAGTAAGPLTPNTEITGAPDGTTAETSASFRFRATLPAARFECRLDGGAWRECASPTTYSGLGQGGHRFEVRAFDLLGEPDPSPAVHLWTIVAAPPPPRPPPPPPSTGTRLASFETGFGEIDGRSTGGSDTLDLSVERAYDGIRSIKVSHRAGGAYARGWYGVDWPVGTEAWYGAAFFIPDTAAVAYADLLRWDNYADQGAGGDVGGVEVHHGTAYMMRQDYNGNNFAVLGNQFGLPAGRWFFMEVHQRLSAVGGQALSEVYIDGAKVTSSVQANSRGRPIRNFRFGYVYADGPDSVLYVDRVAAGTGSRDQFRSVSAGRRPAKRRRRCRVRRRGAGRPQASARRRKCAPRTRRGRRGLTTRWRLIQP